MSKNITSWKRKGSTLPTTDYDSAAVDYDSPTQKYADSGQTPHSHVKTTTAWSKRTKNATQFVRNTLSRTLSQIYNTHRLYNVHDTYSSITIGEPRSTAKKPTGWSR